MLPDLPCSKNSSRTSHAQQRDAAPHAFAFQIRQLPHFVGALKDLTAKVLLLHKLKEIHFPKPPSPSRKQMTQRTRMITATVNY